MLVGVNPVSVTPIDCSSVIDAPGCRHQLLTVSMNDWAATDAVFALMVIVAGSSLRRDRMVIREATILALQAVTAAVGDCRWGCEGAYGRMMIVLVGEVAGRSRDII
jgi:hypothetical protein